MSGAGDHSDERGPQENPPGVPPAGASPTGEGQLDNSANHRQYYILMPAKHRHSVTNFIM